jgi:hypothetical protein
MNILKVLILCMGVSAVLSSEAICLEKIVKTAKVLDISVSHCQFQKGGGIYGSGISGDCWAAIGGTTNNSSIAIDLVNTARIYFQIEGKTYFYLATSARVRKDGFLCQQRGMGSEGGGITCDRSYWWQLLTIPPNQPGVLEDLKLAQLTGVDVNLVIEKGSFQKQSTSTAIPNFNGSDIYEINVLGRKYKILVCPKFPTPDGGGIGCAPYDDPRVPEM